MCVFQLYLVWNVWSSIRVFQNASAWEIANGPADHSGHPNILNVVNHRMERARNGFLEKSLWTLVWIFGVFTKSYMVRERVLVLSGTKTLSSMGCNAYASNLTWKNHYAFLRHKHFDFLPAHTHAHITLKSTHIVERVEYVMKLMNF